MKAKRKGNASRFLPVLSTKKPAIAGFFYDSASVFLRAAPSFTYISSKKGLPQT